MERGFKTRCEQTAAGVRRDLRLPPESPLAAADLADHLGIVILVADDVPGLPRQHLDQLLMADSSSWSALTIQMDGDTFIVHNNSHVPGRQESNIMHEVAHFLLKHAPSQLLELDGLGPVLRTYDRVQEEEASWLGACLQLPRPGLLWAINARLSDEEMSAHFGASASQVRYRRSVTGVDVQHRRRRSFVA